MGASAWLRREEECFRSLVAACYKPLVAYALYRSGDPYLAEEIVSETWLVAWRRRGAIPECPEEQLPWVFAVAKRTSSNVLRAEARRRQLWARLPPVGTEPSAEEQWREALTTSESIAQVKAALGRLSPGEVEVLQLAVWEGRSYAEIGEILGCSVNAVAIRVYRARVSLAAELTENLGQQL